MNRIQEVFGTSHVLLPVIHPINSEAALAAVRVAVDAGVRGVFLIDQGLSEAGLLRLVIAIRALHPTLWLGLNLLSRTPSETLSLALRECDGIDGIWADNAGVDERADANPKQLAASAFEIARCLVGWRGLYFGGVAFKYTREVAAEDLATAAMRSSPFMDVLCTSGAATGQAASIEKVRALREGLGDHAMALASGVTPSNVRSYMWYVQAFLVGTGIERQLGVLDPTKIAALQDAMKEAL
jgi:hypothetical protein